MLDSHGIILSKLLVIAIKI